MSTHEQQNGTDQVDLLVIGGGMAGLTAAARAASKGLRPLVVESTGTLGGNGLYAGYLWTAKDEATMDEWNPDGSEELRHTLVERFPQAVAWVEELGVDIGPAQKTLAYGSGHPFDTSQYVAHCQNAVRQAGEILLRTTVSSLLTEGGRVVGAELTGADGTARTVRAGATLIATGGFQANKELVDELIHPAASTMELRSQSNSKGEGLRLATSVGAATGGENAGFYGHLIPAEIPFRDSGDFVGLSLYYSEHAMLFNLDGERFTDETRADHLTTMALLEQREARGLLIADEHVYQQNIIKPYVEGAPSTDKFADALRRGGRAGVAESLDELNDLPEEWGYDGGAIAKAIEEYNAALEAGDEVSPARSLDRRPLSEPPYYIIETVPALTYPFHGVLIDTDARVLSESGEPIAGLYCAGGDTGGLYHRAYTGGLAAALVYALSAADHVAANR